MEGERELYERSLSWRATYKLNEEREKFGPILTTAINDTNS